MVITAVVTYLITRFWVDFLTRFQAISHVLRKQLIEELVGAFLRRLNGEILALQSDYNLLHRFQSGTNEIDNERPRNNHHNYSRDLED